eukprot:5906956-Pyramimonas_sp.AAC.1
MGLRPEEIPVDDPSAEPDSDDDVPSQPGGSPTVDQLTDLELARDSSGHPSNRDFVRLLRRGDAKPEVARLVLGIRNAMSARRANDPVLAVLLLSLSLTASIVLLVSIRLKSRIRLVMLHASGSTLPVG